MLGLYCPPPAARVRMHVTEESRLKYFAHIPRPLLALVLCGLVIVGGVPQIGCICPSGEYCLECPDCPQLFGIWGSAPQSFRECCCCEKRTDAAQQDHGIRVANSDRCSCEKFATQTVISNPPRTAAVKSIVVTWVPAQPYGLVLGHVDGPQPVSLEDRIPPDSPVSRAQILRL
jgi:hypothetical protein